MKDMAAMNCEIVYIGKRRDGKPKHWCVAHKATATGKYGVKLDRCVAADDPPITEHDTLHLKAGDFDGGVALWGAVPAVFDTTHHPVDRGVHVHARQVPHGKKKIDRTYRRVVLEPDLRFGKGSAPVSIDEIDAIYYMVSTVMKYKMRTVICPRCNHSHLDKDWFSVHYHQKHLCSGCGREFKDNAPGIGNPLIFLKELLGDSSQDRPLKEAGRELNINQSDFRHGIQIWGSNPAIVWTSADMEEEGIHVHCYGHDRLMPDVDDTFSKVVIDGVELNPIHVRTYMAQMALPHIRDVITSLKCNGCGNDHFDQDEYAFSPHVEHECEHCGAQFKAAGRKKKVISNPFHEIRDVLAITSGNTLQSSQLNLRPETI